MRKIKIWLVLGLSVALSGCVKVSSSDRVNKSSNQERLSVPESVTEEQMSDQNKEEVQVKAETVEVVTQKGSFKIKLYPKEAPKTVANFASKAKEGYYDGLIFHRVEDWVVQGGDPLGNGTGGGDMPTELNKKTFKVGSVGVARGANIAVSNDSQFFVCTKESSFLDEKYTNFGEVIEGMDVVNKMEIGDKILKMKVE